MLTPVQMVPTGYLGAALATLYTVPPNATKAELREIRLCNTDTLPRTVTLHMVPAGGVAGGSNKALSALPLAAGETKTLPFVTVMLPGDSIQASADAGSLVTIQVSGLVWT